MPAQHTEHAFETAIEHHLTMAGGCVKVDRDGFDPHRAIFPAMTGKIDVRGEVA